MVPQTGPTRQPSRKGSAGPMISATPWWISYAVTGAPHQEPDGVPSTLSASNLTRTGSRSSPGSSPVPVSTSSAMVAAEHLVAATDAEHRRVAPSPLRQRVGQPAVPQPAQITDGGPGPREHGEIGVGHQARVAGHHDLDPRLGGQCVHVGRVGHPGQPDHGDPQRVRV